MAAAATYETGFFSSPSDLLAAANAVNTQIATLDAALDGNETVPQDWWDSFEAFRSTWLKFFSSTFGGHGLGEGASGSLLSTAASWFTSDVEGQLVSFQQQTPIWIQQAQAYGVNVPGPVLQPNEGPSLPSFTTIAVVLALILAILILTKL